MTTVTRDAGLVIPDRLNLTFSQNGRHATSLRTTDEHVVLESWMLATEQASCRTILDVPVDVGTHALPLDDGRLLLFDRGGISASDRRGLALIHREADGSDLQELGAITAPRGGYLLPSPTSAQLGFAVALGVGHSTIWRLPAPPAPIEKIMRLPGSLSGGVWLDGEAGVLGMNRTTGNSGSSGIAVYLSQGSWKRIWSMSPTSDDQILFYNGHSRLIIVSTNVSGQQLLGWARLGDPSVRFPNTLHRKGYLREALALDDRGERLLVHEVTGARSQLLVYTPADDRLEVLATPPGTVSSPASWTGDLIRLCFSTPCHTPALATIRAGREPTWSLSGGQDLDIQYGGAPPELIELRGPAGPIEAIVYGGPDWRGCEHLVIALHGGPLSSWRFEFEPLFHCLSAEGIAIVAPNYRGSTGYGEEHLRPVISNWGGPDLDDVIYLGRNLEKARASRQLSRPAVLGVSYGGFLALLAACHEPQLWSACVALAPFLSGPRFYDIAHGAVRRRIEQLGGLRPIEDSLGPRDVLKSCAGLSAPLLLMHGSADETIPVEQSRTLRRRLLELGRTEGTNFDYVEVDSDHAELVCAQRTELNQRIVRFCLKHSKASSHCDGKWSRSNTTTEGDNNHGQL